MRLPSFFSTALSKTSPAATRAGERKISAPRPEAAPFLDYKAIDPLLNPWDVAAYEACERQMREVVSPTLPDNLERLVARIQEAGNIAVVSDSRKTPFPKHLKQRGYHGACGDFYTPEAPDYPWILIFLRRMRARRKYAVTVHELVHAIHMRNGLLRSVTADSPAARIYDAIQRRIDKGRTGLFFPGFIRRQFRGLGEDDRHTAYRELKAAFRSEVSAYLIDEQLARYHRKFHARHAAMDRANRYQKAINVINRLVYEDLSKASHLA